MHPATAYGRLSRTELIDELFEVVNTLAAKIKELGALQQDYNNEYYPTYFRAPGNSVAAKEKEAEYNSLPMLNDMALIRADIEVLTTCRDLLYFVIPYAAE
jgi:hypothetical protein